MKRLLIAFVLLLFYAPAWAVLPVFHAAGTVAHSTGAGIAPAIPVTALTNDILLMFLETDNEAVTCCTSGSETWAEVADSPQTQSGTGSTRLTVFWARASQDVPTAGTTGTASDHIVGRVIVIRGVITTGDPWDVTSGGTEGTADTSGSITGDTTTVDDCLVVMAMASGLPDSNSTSNFTSLTNGDLGSVTEHTDNCRNRGNGGCVMSGSGTLATNGTYGATTVTLGTASVKGFMTIALKPPAGGGPTRSRVVDVQ